METFGEWGCLVAYKPQGEGSQGCSHIVEECHKKKSKKQLEKRQNCFERPWFERVNAKTNFRETKKSVTFIGRYLFRRSSADRMCSVHII